MALARPGPALGQCIQHTLYDQYISIYACILNLERFSFTEKKGVFILSGIRSHAVLASLDGDLQIVFCLHQKSSASAFHRLIIPCSSLSFVMVFVHSAYIV